MFAWRQTLPPCMCRALIFTAAAAAAILLAIHKAPHMSSVVRVLRAAALPAVAAPHVEAALAHIVTITATQTQNRMRMRMGMGMHTSVRAVTVAMGLLASRHRVRRSLPEAMVRRRGSPHSLHVECTFTVSSAPLWPRSVSSETWPVLDR